MSNLFKIINAYIKSLFSLFTIKLRFSEIKNITSLYVQLFIYQSQKKHEKVGLGLYILVYKFRVQLQNISKIYSNTLRLSNT